MGVQIEESVASAAEAAGFVAGAERAGEFRCSDCGYGAVVQRVLPLCPMCGGSVWEPREPRTPRFVD